MTDTRKLFVLWREPTDGGHRHVIGHLWEADGEFHFAYASTLSAAKAAGGKRLPARRLSRSGASVADSGTPPV